MGYEINHKSQRQITDTIMALKIILSSTLRRYIPDYDPSKGMEVSVEKGTTITRLCRQLKIPVDKIKTVMVNGKSQNLDYSLDGDERIGLFPAVGGG